MAVLITTSPAMTPYTNMSFFMICPLLPPPAAVEKLALRALPVITRKGDLALITRKDGRRRQNFKL
jgi:hypothetical protein